MKRILFAGIMLLLGRSVSAQQNYQYDPPWNQPPAAGVNFTVPGVDNVPDLYGDITDPQLVIFFAGNQFMCLDSLLTAFKKAYPKYQRIFVETLPPGILAEQIKKGSLTMGNLHISTQPDVYAAGKTRMTEMTPYMSYTAPYAYNQLSLMVYKGNPKNIQGLTDLRQSGIRVSMPNPAWEGIGRQIETAYQKAGGEELRQAVMQAKTNDSTTYLTRIHHRESPMRILYQQSDVAPVWSSEVFYQKMLGHPVEEVVIPEKENIRATYMIGQLKKAPHPAAAKDFIKFIQSAEGKRIYRMYGFQTE